MKQFFLILFILSGFFGHAVFAEDAPSDEGDKPTAPAEPAPKPEDEEEEEPDCE